VCATLGAVVFVVEVSPKSQNRLVIVPVELSVNVTDNGASPLIGLPLNVATGTIAPVPVTVLVESPLLGVEKTTLLVNVAALTGANRTVTLVEPKPGTLKLPPETIVNGPPPTVTVPLVIAVPPELVTTKLAWAVAPAARMSKSILAGVTPMFPAVMPPPPTSFVELPPVLVKIAVATDGPEVVGI
jgi:hypothetical protein